MAGKLIKRDDGRCEWDEDAFVVRYLLDDGRTLDVITRRDESELRAAVLKWTGAGRIEGSARLPV